MGGMDRRSVLAAGVAAAATLAGCTEGNEGARADRDGDGIADADDYAPGDPEVQSKSDLMGVASEATRTVDAARTTATTTATTTTTGVPTSGTTTASGDAGDANTLTVERAPGGGRSAITAYGAERVTARVLPDGPSAGRFEDRRVRLLVVARRFPRSESVGHGVSDPVRLSEPTTLTADVSLDGVEPDGGRLQYLAYLLPAGINVEEASGDDLAFFHETDPFVLRADGVTVERAPLPDALADDRTDRYERRAVEGAYHLTFEGRTEGRDWSVDVYVYKSAYRRANRTPRGRSRAEYVTYALQEGFADELARILVDEAAAHGFESRRARLAFVVDVVQTLPYVPDDVSTGYDDYTKFLAETLAEGGGDCEDTAIMLAAVLQTDPFDYDAILVQPPGHMAVGIADEGDFSGTYWELDGERYYYVETTSVGWAIGDLPETYRGETAYLHRV